MAKPRSKNRNATATKEAGDGLGVSVGDVLMFHGFAHLMGFAAYLRLATIDVWPYSATLLPGRLEVDKAGPSSTACLEI